MAEKKYIDAEAIAGVLRKEYNKYGFCCSALESHAMGVIDSISRGIRELPAADVEEVIRCRNCRYWLEGHYCMYDDQVHTYSDFCSWAERIEKPDENAGN